MLYGNSRYLGLDKRDEMRCFGGIEYKISRKPSMLKASLKGGGFNADRDEERRKSSVRCKAERVFLIVKRDFGYAKARHRGIAKNAQAALLKLLPSRTPKVRLRRARRGLLLRRSLPFGQMAV